MLEWVKSGIMLDDNSNACPGARITKNTDLWELDEKIVFYDFVSVYCVFWTVIGLYLR